jgi:hypothetical protein
MTETADPRVVEIDHFYPHPPQRVWRARTTPELMARCLMAPERKRGTGGTSRLRGTVSTPTTSCNSARGPSWATAGFGSPASSARSCSASVCGAASDCAAPQRARFPPASLRRSVQAGTQWVTVLRLDP